MGSPFLDRARLEPFIDGVVRHAIRQDGIAGVTVAIVGPSGPVMIKGYGITAPGRLVAPDTLFPLQSISKAMVWIAVMQLVEQAISSLA